jgi:arylformamidase
MKIHDISILIDKNMLLYPGDKQVIIQQLKNLESEEWNLTEMRMSSHTGTHLDTPKHVLKDGIGIDQLNLARCVGKSIVIDLSSIPFGDKITREHLEQISIEKNDIVLLKTRNSSILTKKYNPDYVDLSIDGAQYLEDKRINAVAIDYLSIGPKEVHETLLKNDVLVYETVNLMNIQPGKYIFVGLPLKIGTEGCPVRAILIENF